MLVWKKLDRVMTGGSSTNVETTHGYGPLASSSSGWMIALLQWTRALSARLGTKESHVVIVGWNHRLNILLLLGCHAKNSISNMKEIHSEMD
jgi:hypothetical protein